MITDKDSTAEGLANALPASFGERVRRLRLAAGMSQTDLARALTGDEKGGNSLISKIENGRQSADEALVQKLSELLRCSSEYLAGPPLALSATRPWLRAYADAPSRVVESVTADNALAAESIVRLELDSIHDGIPTFDGDLNDDYAIERFAEEVRVAAGFDEGQVVGNAMRAADRLGCVVLPLDGELGRHLGMSQRINRRSFIRVSRPFAGKNSVPGDRQRFTVLHEVGHLGLHSDLGAPESAEEAKRIEKQAHRFAGAFLTPADPLLDDWSKRGGRVTLPILAELKATWGIAVKALVVRFQQLGVIDANHATSLYKQISKRGWNQAEPVQMTNEEPIWLDRAIRKRFPSRSISIDLGSAARVALLSEGHLRNWLDWTPVDPPAGVYELSRRERTPSDHATRDADVVGFRHRSKRISK